jgi:hypothetical protein
VLSKPLLAMCQAGKLEFPFQPNLQLYPSFKFGILNEKGSTNFFVLFFDKSEEILDYNHFESEEKAKEFLSNHFYNYLNRLPREWFCDSGFEDSLAPNEKTVLHPDVVYEFELLMDMVEERINELGEKQDVDYDFSLIN